MPADRREVRTIEMTDEQLGDVERCAELLIRAGDDDGAARMMGLALAYRFAPAETLPPVLELVRGVRDAS